MTELFFWILCLAAFVQDLKTRYFSSWWLLPCLLILLAAGLHPGPSLLFCALVLILHLLRRDWIGLADVTAMAFLSLLTGSALYPLTVVACLLGSLDCSDPGTDSPLRVLSERRSRLACRCPLNPVSYKS